MRVTVSCDYLPNILTGWCFCMLTVNSPHLCRQYDAVREVDGSSTRYRNAAALKSVFQSEPLSKLVDMVS